MSNAISSSNLTLINLISNFFNFKIITIFSIYTGFAYSSFNFLYTNIYNYGSYRTVELHQCDEGCIEDFGNELWIWGTVVRD